MIYQRALRPLLFQVDSEKVHELALRMGQLFSSRGLCGAVQALSGEVPDGLQCEVMGLKFRSPVGLAAGFDKECSAVPALHALGFGFIEIGTVTAQPQSGNPRPRIFRLPEDDALINRMGFPSEGAKVAAARLQRLRDNNFQGIIGVNIGKSKVVEIDRALDDYLQSYQMLYEYGDYFVVNVSSPNTPDLRKLQERARLTELLQGIQAANSEKKPLLVKVAPDLTLKQLDDVLLCCFDSNLSGIVATNTTFSREGLSSDRRDEQGGLSGKPLFKRSLELVRYLVEQAQGKLTIIGAGGIMSKDDAALMLDAGANLVQVYTGLIYNGPFFIQHINRHLAVR